MLVRIKRKLYEEPLESVVLNREEATQKRATVNDLRHALQDSSLDGPQVFRLLSTTPDASLPSNLLDTIARRKKEWASRPRRTSPRKNVKTSFEPQQQQVTGNLLLQQSKASRQARVWNCRRTKVQGFSVLELSGENNQEEGGERRKRPAVNPLNANRLKELEQEAKARLTDSTTKSLKQARGWRKWQQEHRPEQQEQPPPQAVVPSPDAAPLPEQYAALLREYLGEDMGELNTPVNISVSTSAFPHAFPLSSSSSASSPSASHSSTTSSLPSCSAASSSSSDPMDNSHDYNSDDDGERDYVWDLYYCCGSEMEDPNAERLTYRSAGEESEDPNEKEHDYSDEEEDEGDSSEEEEESEDSDDVLNKRVARIEQEEEEEGDDEDEDEEEEDEEDDDE